MKNNYIDKDTIKQYGSSLSGRKDNFDDDIEVRKFINFAKNYYSNKYVFVDKPYGKYGVDIGIRLDDKIVHTFDVERWNSWDKDWPHYYKYISFLGRKEKFLNVPNNFTMVWFNNSLNKMIVVSKKNLLGVPTVSKQFSSNKKVDRVKKVPFNMGHLIGSNLTEQEKRLFLNHEETDLL